MSDIIDDANDRAEMDRERLIAIARDTRPVAPLTGSCLACGEPQSDRRWCDADCRDFWELARRRAPGVDREVS